ncbi:MAG TPA: RibD family protein, partial [Pyrinomonadaceae bacterium]|nr:RibD family protein [Pyrinomonadaceae bacterium]
TAFIDDPSLTDRSGKPRRRALVRVILDNRLRIKLDSRLVATAPTTPTIVFTNSHDTDKIRRLRNAGVDVVQAETGGRDLVRLLDELKARGLQSVLVEGGTEVAGAFCDARLIDKVTFIVAPFIIGGPDAPAAVGGTGVASLTEALRLTDLSIERLGDDVEITGYPAQSRER